MNAYLFDETRKMQTSPTSGAAVRREHGVYLKQNTKIEPLVSRWYAWGHLISPAQRALNVAYRQIPMLKSFVSNPGVHEAASKNPALYGGNFLELRRQDVPAVQMLLRHMLNKETASIQFAEDLMKLDRAMQKSDKGMSLDHHYENLPDLLAGLTEVSYDMNNHSMPRLIEELLYGTPLDLAAEHEISFCTTADDARHFFLNTPRLNTGGRMSIPMSFDDRRLDLLGLSRIDPVPLDELASAFGMKDEETDTFQGFFTAEPPVRNQPEYAGDGIRVRYFGHACVLLQTRNVSILVDPFLTWDQDDTASRLTFHDLPDFIDFVFLTHNHQDHFCAEALLQLRKRVGCVLVPRNNPYNIADPSMKLALRRLGFHNVRIMDPMDCLEFQDGAITSLPFYGEHADLSISSKHAMHVDLKGKTFMFVADSDAKDAVLYRRLAERLGKVDHLFVGMECDGAPLNWLYSPYLSTPIGRKEDESRRLSGSDADHALRIVEQMGCKTAHVYALGQEPWLKYVAGLAYTEKSKQIVESDKFVQSCREKGIQSERLHGCQTMEF
jgi:L-ascorbate metabolism protein UlaG (beta-lactamase superfamily)